MIFPFGEAVTVESRVAGPPDRYSNPTYTWVARTVEGCGFDPGNSTETVLPYRVDTDTRPTLYAPPGTAVAPTDRIVVRGEQFQVDGEVAVWVSPFTGWSPGVVIKLKRAEG